jgi:Uma2 family endonuclease
MNSSIISRILESPDAYLIVDAAERALEKERELRLKFLDEITDDDRVEFINGEIIKHAPECLKHNRVNGLVLRLLGLCVTKQQNGEFGFGKLMICLTRNAYQPDFCFFNNEKSSQFTADQTLFPAPNFIAEIISISSEQRDRGVLDHRPRL